MKRAAFGQENRSLEGNAYEKTKNFNLTARAMCCIPSRARRKTAPRSRFTIRKQNGRLSGEKVQRQYVEFLSDWRTDLGGRKNFHNGAGGRTTALRS